MTRKNALFRIKRFTPGDDSSRLQDYTVPLSEGLTVLEGLWYIVHYRDDSLSFRYSCRGGVCGSCAMIINETIRLACNTQVASLESDTVLIEPLPRMRVLKDLVVDMDRFLEKYRSIDPWLLHGAAHEREVVQTPDERRRIFDSVKCILCASCHAACPLTAVHDDYLGPAALTAAQRLAFDSRHDARDAVLASVNDAHGADGCRTISRCTEVCPREIAPSERIKELKERIAARSVDGTLKRQSRE
ncbi:succinate dehydrogenase iron-sulfur subunit [bacterium]|nr:succinate dehydrogenase iron-sulfur subunit [bacterium]